MKKYLIFVLLLICFLSCKTKTPKTTSQSIQLLIPDTTNNRRAQWDLRDINYHSKLESQIGLSDLKKGTDSLEIRLWSSFPLSDIEELYILKFHDTTCLMSYLRVYPKRINFKDENRNTKWDPFKDPIIDSIVSKSLLVSNRNLKEVHFDSIWLLKSQSELNIPDSIGFSDCDMNSIEIADKNRFKFLRYHCSMGYYDKIKLESIYNYINFCNSITLIFRELNAKVPYRYD